MRALLVALLLFWPTLALAWTHSEIGRITDAIHAELPGWDTKQTVELLQEAQGAADFSSNINGTSIKIIGKTVLVNGKDVTGVLGNKSTYGSNSPIIGDIDGSNVAVGELSSVEANRTDFYFNLTLGLTFALSFSIPCNIYLWRQLRTKRQGK